MRRPGDLADDQVVEAEAGAGAEDERECEPEGEDAEGGRAERPGEVERRDDADEPHQDLPGRERGGVAGEPSHRRSYAGQERRTAISPGSPPAADASDRASGRAPG